MAGLSLVLTVMLAAALALAPVVALRRHEQRARRSQLTPRVEPLMILMDDKAVVDTTSPARAFLKRINCPTPDLLLAWLDTRLPGASSSLPRAADDGEVELAAPDGLALRVEHVAQGLFRLTLSDPGSDAAAASIDPLSLRALEDEVELLREVAAEGPFLCWRQRVDGEIVWANDRYLQLCEVLGDGRGLWPLPRLFEIPLEPPCDSGHEVTPLRRMLQIGGEERWFDCLAAHISPQEATLFALPADAAVRAEVSLRQFVQTLTKTFAGLPIGLAIFDRERRLQLFNPALLDLTGLPTGFLSGRPTLMDTLDRLRETRMLPEPRDYRSWRQQMATLEAESATDQHVESWSLPGGQTYRMTGRPHADGGIAILLEDLTSEVTRTRGFRADLAVQGQVLDAIGEAVAVFGIDGTQQLSNLSWRELWGEDAQPLHRMAETWLQIGGSDGAGAQRLQDALRAPDGARHALSGTILGPDGTPLGWRLRSLPGGRLMVSFLRDAVAALDSAPATEEPAARFRQRSANAAS